MSTLTQGYALLLFIYGGVVLGVLYDAARLMRLFARKRITAHLSDALFTAAFGAVSMGAFYVTTGGALRLYGFCAMGLGMALQQWAFGRPICKLIVNREKSRRSRR